MAASLGTGGRGTNDVRDLDTLLKLPKHCQMRVFKRLLNDDMGLILAVVMKDAICHQEFRKIREIQLRQLRRKR